jgi:hypothetical protein
VAHLLPQLWVRRVSTHAMLAREPVATTRPYVVFWCKELTGRQTGTFSGPWFSTYSRIVSYFRTGNRDSRSFLSTFDFL